MGSGRSLLGNVPTNFPYRGPVSQDILEISFLYTILSEEPKDRLLDDLLITFEIDWRFGGVRNTERIKSFLTEHFLSEELLFAYFQALQSRGGVQLIYGGQLAFIDFLKDQKVEPADNWGAQIFSDIPGSLIAKVVPLGKYERDKLMLTH